MAMRAARFVLGALRIISEMRGRQIAKRQFVESPSHFFITFS